jgi:hypothetical protein
MVFPLPTTCLSFSQRSGGGPAGLELVDDAHGLVDGDREADVLRVVVWLEVATAVLMPITWPAALTSGPPEFPELMEAAVRTTVVVGVGDGSSPRVTTPPAEPATRATPRNAAAIRHGLRRRGGGGGGGVVCSGGVQLGGAPGAHDSGSSAAGGSSTED